MDTSKKYIQMSNCSEMQTVWNSTEDAITTKDGVWLPRQDQLQAMYKYSNIHTINEWFDDWYKRDGIVQEYPYQFKTAEQLWLALIMETIYDKKWDSNRQEWMTA